MTQTIFFHGKDKFLIGGGGPGEKITLTSQRTFRTNVHHADGIELRETNFRDPGINIGCWVGKHMKTFSELDATSPFKKHYAIEQLWWWPRLPQFPGDRSSPIFIPGDPTVLRELGEALLSEADKLEREGHLSDSAENLSRDRKLWREEFNKANPRYEV